MNDRPLPSQLSEAAFRRYEPLFKQALANMPAETEFSVPEGMSPHTFVARLRDARVSGIKFRWKTDLDLDKLGETLYSRDRWVFAMSPNGKSVWFKRAAPKGRPTELKTEGLAQHTPAQTFGALNLANLNAEEWYALAILVHYGRLATPLAVKGDAPPQPVLDLESTHNISFVRDDSRGETIVT